MIIDEFMNDWQKWRRQARERIVTVRMAVPDALHQQWGAAIAALLQQGFPNLHRMKIGLYWPFRNEYDPREAVLPFSKTGAILAMPEVIDKHKPLCFREWWPGAPMRKGAYTIPVPDDTPYIEPDVLIVPMVGFDMKGYRLGYGSGYYDRTLASYAHRPHTIGVAFELQRLETVYPQPHDIVMQYVVTEAGIFQSSDSGLVPISIEQCAVDNASV